MKFLDIDVVEFDECLNQPCSINGMCIDEIDQFSCQCQAGFSGKTCQHNINECLSSPCQNSATCQDGINMYTCTCVPGFTGQQCEVNIDKCSSSPCNKGRCIDQINSYGCQCFPGYSGLSCNEGRLRALIEKSRWEKRCMWARGTIGTWDIM